MRRGRTSQRAACGHFCGERHWHSRWRGLRVFPHSWFLAVSRSISSASKSERIGRFADLVGRERVIAGTDCGFGTFAGFGPVDPDIAYMKLGAMVEGARITSERLWGKAA